MKFFSGQLSGIFPLVSISYEIHAISNVYLDSFYCSSFGNYSWSDKLGFRERNISTSDDWVVLVDNNEFCDSSLVLDTGNK